MKITYIGGPTALLEFGNLHVLTDPTFDVGGSEYQLGTYSLHKLQGPAILPEALPYIDIVLLSHDHHYDNLDIAGRDLLGGVGTVITTTAGAQRLGSPSIGLSAWESHDFKLEDGSIFRVTATLARHGPSGGDRGPVIGFILQHAKDTNKAIYFSGDTVWYEGIEEVASRFSVHVAILNMGAARVSAAGPEHLTFTAAEGIKVANVFPQATIVPLHFEGWAHFTESRQDIEAAFAVSNLQHQLRWLRPGISETFDE